MLKMLKKNNNNPNKQKTDSSCMTKLAKNFFLLFKITCDPVIIFLYIYLFIFSLKKKIK